MGREKRRGGTEKKQKGAERFELLLGKQVFLKSTQRRGNSAGRKLSIFYKETDEATGNSGEDFCTKSEAEACTLWWWTSPATSEDEGAMFSSVSASTG